MPMNNLACCLDGEPILRTATVQAVCPLPSDRTSAQREGQDVAYLVAGPLGLVRASRAAGCLLAPERGDKVLVFLSPEESYILSVLAKAKDTGELVLPGETLVKAAKLGLDATDKLTLAAPQVQVQARAFSLKSVLARLEGQTLLHCFASLQTRAGRLVEQVGRRFGFFDKVVERVEDVHETEAGRVRLTSRESLRVRAHNADVRAEESVLVDGRTIKIG